MYILQKRTESRNPWRKRWIKRAAFAALLLAGFAAINWRSDIIRALRLPSRIETKKPVQTESSTSPATPAIIAANFANEQLLVAAAEYLDIARESAASLKLRRRLVELSPLDANRHLDLILCALQQKDYAAAKDALQESQILNVDNDNHLTFELLEAIAAQRTRATEVLYDQARKFAEDSPERSLRLYRLRLQLTTPNIASLILSEIQKLAKDPKLRIPCLREQLFYFMRTGDLQSAKKRAQDLKAVAGISFEDMLVCANVALLTQQSTQDELIAELSPLALRSGAAAAQFTTWLIMQGRTTDAGKWLDKLPVDIGSQSAVLTARADLAVARKDWTRLGNFLEQQAWGSISPQAVRLAMSSRLLNERRASEITKQMWEQALYSTQENITSLQIMLRVARTWQWDAQIESTLQTISSKYPSATWAYWSLSQLASQGGDTNKLRELFARWHAADPGNAAVENEWAMLSLLSLPEQQNPQAREAAARLNSSNPKHSAFATSQAFSLWQQGRSSDALSVLRKLRTDELRDPRRALYCALILVEEGKIDIAEKFLPLVDATKLLPEEKKLMQLARGKIQEAVKQLLDDASETDDPFASGAASRPTKK